MQGSVLNRISAFIAEQFTRFFHTRNIIIVSEHKVKHIPINAGVQFFVVMAAVGALGWGTYSTGTYVTNRATMKEQRQTIRAVVGDRVASNFGVLQPNFNMTPYRSKSQFGLSQSMLSLSAPDPLMFYSHIAKLEQQVTELKSDNQEIIARVKEKTAGRIDNLESLLRNTGLNTNDLKRQFAKNKGNKKRNAEHSNVEPAQGGPYIPDDLSSLTSGEAKELFSDLDELALLRQIVDNLPFASPMRESRDFSPFGRRIDPINGKLAFHSGIDLAGPENSEIFSTGAGKVIAAGRDGAYGNTVDIDHGYGIVTRYSHLSKILVEKGQKVSTGQLIGIQGSTGRATGEHLHYEVRYHDKPLNPRNFLQAQRYVSVN